MDANDFNKLVVLDLSDSSINIYTLSEEECKYSDRELLIHLGHKEEECSYMWCKNLTLRLK